MPIHLKAPHHNPNGPDGQGWNRLSLGSLAGDQCALRPQDYTHLREAQNTVRARYGGYGPCIRSGDCGSCPILQAAPRRLQAFDNSVLVRVNPHNGDPYLMNREEEGWGSSSWRWTWQDLARVDGWEIGRPFHDVHSEGFWLERCPTP